jgi:hypothetical protein
MVTMLVHVSAALRPGVDLRSFLFPITHNAQPRHQ